MTRNSTDNELMIKIPIELRNIDPNQLGIIKNYKNYVELQFYFKALKENLSDSKMYSLLDSIDKEMNTYRIKDRKGYLAFQFREFNEDTINFIENLSNELKNGLYELNPDVYEHLEIEETLEEVCDLEIVKEQFPHLTYKEVINQLQQENSTFKELYHPLANEELELPKIKIGKSIQQEISSNEVQINEHKIIKITRYLVNIWVVGIYVVNRIKLSYKKSR